MGRPRNTEKRSTEQAAFLSVFALTGVAKTAAAEAGIKPVKHYRWLKDDPLYAARFAELQAQTRDLARASRKPHRRGYRITEGPRADKRYRDQEKLLKALAARSGIVMDAVADVGLYPSQFYQWCRTYPEFRARAEQILARTEDARRAEMGARWSAGSRAAWNDQRRAEWGKFQRQTWTPGRRQAMASLAHQRMTDPEFKARWLAQSLAARPAVCDDPHYFDQIDTPDKAYWLGFIATDGCIRKTGPNSFRLVIKLARRDRGHLEILHSALGARRPIRDTDGWSKPPGTTERKLRPVSVFDLCSEGIATALIGHGITPRKTDNVEAWDGPAWLIPHYWRGVIDGDGSFGTYDGETSLSLCGSRPLVAAFRGWAHGICGTTANLRRGTKGNRRYWLITIGGNIRARNLIAALYDSAPVALARKKAQADLIVHGKPFSPTLF